MVEFFHCSLGENPKGHLKRKGEKEKEKRKTKTKTKQKKRSGGNLGENPKGRQGRISAMSKHKEEQLVVWSIWTSPHFCHTSANIEFQNKDIQRFEYASFGQSCVIL